ncbi:hypothetical protein ACJX0J_011080 [Zea mays]
MKQGPNRDISLILEMVTCFIILNNVFANVVDLLQAVSFFIGFILIPIFLEQTLGFGSVHVSINSRIKVVKLLRRLHGESTQDKAIWTINKKRFSVKSLYLNVLVACHKE